MNAKRDKILFNKRRQTGVFVRLFFEPLTSASGRRRAEIDEQRFVLSLRLLQSLVGVFDPVD